MVAIRALTMALVRPKLLTTRIKVNTLRYLADSCNHNAGRVDAGGLMNRLTDRFLSMRERIALIGRVQVNRQR